MKKTYIFLFIFTHVWSLYSIVITIKPKKIHDIGKKIWENESRARIDGLITWNQGEDFASLGIGHFIWCPSGKIGVFHDSFPSLLSYFSKQGKKIPEWLCHGCPWKNRSEFISAKKSKQMNELRNLLTQTIDLQAKFMVERFIKLTKSKLLHKKISKQAYANLYAMAQVQNGIYALIDYINFKGEGLSNTAKEYGNQGWGLLQVLEEMNSIKSDKKTAELFAQAAKRVLTQRVRNAPPERNEEHWLSGWLKRIDTYTEALS